MNKRIGFIFNQITSALIILPRTQLEKFLSKSSSLSSELKQRLVREYILLPRKASIRVDLPLTKKFTIWLHLGNVCNLRCPYCFVYKLKPQVIKPEEAIDYLRKVIRILKNKGYKSLKIKYSGGEPSLSLLFKNFLSIHEALVKMAIENNILLEEVFITNGTNLDEEKIKILKSCNIHVALSMDGWGRTHDLTRSFPSGEGSFKRVLRSLEFLERSGVSFNISVVVNKINLDSLEELIKFAFDRVKPIRVKLNFVRDNPNSSESMMPEIDHMIAKMKRLIDLAYSIIKKRRQDPMLLSGFLDYISLTSPKEFTCEAGRNYMALKKGGLFSTCHMLLDSPVGTLKTKDTDFLGEMSRFDVPKRIPVDEKTYCRDCQIKYLCGGGCPLLTFYSYGKWNAPSPYCKVYKKLTPYLISRIAGLFWYLKRDKDER